MKKYIFSFLLIGTFASYVAYIQVNDGLERKASIVIVGNSAPTTTSPSPIPAYVPLPVSAEDDKPIIPTPIQRPIPVAVAPRVPTIVPSPMPMHGSIYRDGSYTGAVADAYYGNVQVKVVIQNGKIIDVQFLDHPQDRNRSIEINNYAMPLLTREVILAQSASVDVVSGATATSGAVVQSLTSALAQAKI